MDVDVTGRGGLVVVGATVVGALVVGAVVVDSTLKGTEDVGADVEATDPATALMRSGDVVPLTSALPEHADAKLAPTSPTLPSTILVRHLTLSSALE